MATSHNTSLSSSTFPQVHEGATILEEIQRVERFYPTPAHLQNLVHCYWSDEHCDCRKTAVVHRFADDLEYCERHFLMAEKAGL